MIDVRGSRLEGRGVFATRATHRGGRLGRWVGERTTRNDRHTCWMMFPEGWRGYKGRGRLRFLNHADRPNSEFRGLELFATRAIRPGDEVTIDYGPEYEWDDGHRKAT